MRALVPTRRAGGRRLGLACALIVLSLIGPPAGAASVRAASGAAPAAAAPREAVRTGVTMRAGAHPGFTRLVFDLPPGGNGLLLQDGATLTLRFTTPGIPAIPPGAIANVQAVRAEDGVVVVTLAPRVRARSSRLSDRLVLDLLDPPGARAAVEAPAGIPAADPPQAIVPPRQQPPRQAEAARAGMARPPGLTATPAVASPQPPTRGMQTGEPPTREAPTGEASPAENVTPAPVADVTAAPLPPPSAGGAASLALAANVASRDAAAALRLPFGTQTGAAAFRIGDDALLVFDERRPIDTASLRDDPSFGGATVQLLQGGTLVRLKLPATATLSLARSPDAWEIRLEPRTDPANSDRLGPGAANAGAAALPPIRPIFEEGDVRLPATAPGRVVAVPNPQTGGVLLVGTQRVAGQGVAVARRNPVLTLLPTWQGVAVDPAADAIAMRVDKDGFIVGGDSPARPLPLARGDGDAAAMAEASRLTRRFDLPALDVAALRRRLGTAIQRAAAAPLQSRTPDRLAVVQAMLALGLGAEAQGVLAAITAQDPGAGDDPDVRALTAMTALLAGRRDEADGLDDPRLSGTDEIALWRAIRSAMREDGAAAAAPVLAAESRLLLGYPAPLRARLLGLAAETMVEGGEAAAARLLVAARPDDASLDLARAQLEDRDARAGGDPAPALALYDRLAAGRDRLAGVRAMAAAVELRLAAHQMTPAQAAEALERRLFSWRGDGRELALRLRTAALWREAGEWRRGLALLRDTEAAWPEQSPAIRRLLGDMFAAALADDGQHPLPPLELVALSEENADLLPGGEAGRLLAARLADRLVALDLPARAIPALGRVMAVTPPGPGRAELGRHLAELQLRRQDAAGALATLDASEQADLPADLAESRGLLRARAAAAAGDLTLALTILRQIDTPAADQLRATLLESAKDWPGATAALVRYAARSVPADGPLDETQGRTLVRLASAAAQSGDEATLARIRAEDGARMPPGELTRLFSVLTEPPIQQVADLPRVAREAALARTIPESLRALPSSGPRPLAAR